MSEAASTSRRITPVMMAGGAGTRLWPMSRSLYPKQFLSLTGAESLLQATCRRVADPARFAAPLILCNTEHRFMVAEQLRLADVSAQAIVLEPLARGTAAAIALGTVLAARADPQALLLVLAADSHIERPDAFLAAVHAAAPVAEAGRLVMFGITPDRPETDYGYIRPGSALNGAAGVHLVEGFHEKPDRATAESFVAAGYLWNSGNFLFRADVMLAELERLEPDLLASCRKSVELAKPSYEFLQLDGAALKPARSKSIDYAVMEHTDRAAVVRSSGLGWSDVGSWDALWGVSSKDADGNVLMGDTLVQDVRGSYVRGNGRLIAAVGVENMIIVESDDVIFIAPRHRAAAAAKGMVERLKQAARTEADIHKTVDRPWGSYKGVDAGDRFQVKRLVVKPGGRLSAQTHHHRSEHWVVVRGTARVTIGKETRLVCENESVYIPAGTLHRLENPGKLPLHLIEVQTGSYLGEDDIVRHDDDYGR
jgi:mannose-1-phosphate guanylyltransferase / mannose-6-phosphate isomerase